MMNQSTVKRRPNRVTDNASELRITRFLMVCHLAVTAEFLSLFGLNDA